MDVQAEAAKKVSDVKHTTRRAVSNPLIIWLARLGYAAKGVIYLVIGLLAILLVTNHGGQTTDQNGAIKAIYASPLGEGFGRLLIVIVTVGLFGFALWSLLQALLDTEGQGHEFKGIMARIGYGCVAVSYGLLGVVGCQVALAGSTSASSRNSTHSTQDWTGLLLNKPGGVLLVILVGALVLGVAAFLMYKALRARFMQRLNLEGVGSLLERGVRGMGSLGHGALSVVFTIIGVFLIVAALRHNPNDAKGLDSALLELLKQPSGPWLLGVVALGLIAYGIYSFVEARYRRVG